MTNFQKIVPLTAALLLAAPSLANAQTMPSGQVDVTGLHQVDDDDTTVMWNNLSADRLDDMDIVNAAGNKIGEVEDVLADGDGNILAVIVEVSGFLGIGEKEIVIAIDRFQLQGDKLLTSMTEEQLKALPSWED